MNAKERGQAIAGLFYLVAAGFLLVQCVAHRHDAPDPALAPASAPK